MNLNQVKVEGPNFFVQVKIGNFCVKSFGLKSKFQIQNLRLKKPKLDLLK
jgi:hypothetical protein